MTARSAGALLRRRLVLWLTTSPRAKIHRCDVVGDEASIARHDRNRVQHVNDFFHHAGQGAQYSRQWGGVMLQGRGEGMAWSYLLLPAGFTVLVITFITFCGIGGRQERSCSERNYWQQHLEATFLSAEVAKDELQATKASRPVLKAALQISEEEVRLVSALENNIDIINTKLLENENRLH